MYNSKHPLYRTWYNMKQRCYNEATPDYAYYGARGIGVCDRWLNSLEAFATDMGEKPSPQHTVDRINNEGNYTPSNCKWSTFKEQNRNRRSNRIFEVNGVKLCLVELAEMVDLDAGTLAKRLETKSLKDSLAMEYGIRRITAHGKTMSVPKWSEETGIPVSTIKYRLISMSPEDALKAEQPAYERTGKSKKVQQLTLDGVLVKRFNSAREASKALKISQGNITMACKGARNSAGGYRWRYQ